MTHRFPSPPRRTIAIVAVAFCTGVALVAAFETGDREVFRGTVHVVTHNVAAEQAGRLVELSVSLGDELTPEQPVAVLKDDLFESRFRTATDELRKCESELRAAEARADVDLTWRLRSIDREIHETRLQSATELEQQYAVEFREAMWQEFVKELTGMQDGPDRSGVFTPISFNQQLPGESRLRAMIAAETARNTAEVHEARVAMCEARVDSLQHLKQDLEQKIRSAARIDELELQRDILAARVAELEAVSPEQVIQAGAFGTVSWILADAHSRVTAGQTILEMSDHDRTWIEAYIPSRRIERFAEGREVSIRFTDDHRRTGRVVSVAPNAMDSSPHDDALVVVRIEPAGKLWPQLPIGSTVEVEPID